MKISTRISIYFSIVASLILIIFGTTIYFLESQHQHVDFQNRLKNRVEITENFFLEKESFSEQEYDKIRNQFLHTLSGETEEVIKLDDSNEPNFKLEYPASLQNQLLTLNNHSFEFKNIQGESKHFNIKGNNYLIIVTASDITGEENLSFLLNAIVLLICLAIPLFFAVSFIITRRLLLPLSKKIERANEIGAANLNQRLVVLNPKDEIGKLATAFNKLLDRLEISFDAQKSFISNASHEIRNPLTAIIGQSEVTLSKQRTPEDYQTALLEILEVAESLNLTMTNLLQLSKINANEKGVLYDTLEIGSFFIAIKKSYDFQNPQNQINITVPNQKITVQANKNLLQTALLNLFDNACKYSNNQQVEINLNQKADQLIMEIIDQGIGIPESDLQKIKAPFYRAKNAISFNGSGIGLALSHKIITLHGGMINIESQENKGTQITVLLPLT